MLSMPLRRLTTLEAGKLQEEGASLSASIEGLVKLLASPEAVMQVVAQEAQEVAKKFGSPRRTQVTPGAGMPRPGGVHVCLEPCCSHAASRLRGRNAQVPGSQEAASLHALSVEVHEYIVKSPVGQQRKHSMHDLACAKHWPLVASSSRLAATVLPLQTGHPRLLQQDLAPACSTATPQHCPLGSLRQQSSAQPAPCTAPCPWLPSTRHSPNCLAARCGVVARCARMWGAC